MTLKIDRIPAGIVRGVNWSGGMEGALRRLVRGVRKARRRKGPQAMKEAAFVAAAHMVQNWDDGSWFEMWAEGQEPGKAEMIAWARETLPLQGEAGRAHLEQAGDYELCRFAFQCCVYLHLTKGEV